MSQYDDEFNQLYSILLKKDEEDRKTKNFSKYRSEMEALEYRIYFNDSYKQIAEAFINSVISDYGTFPSPNEFDNAFIHNIQTGNMHNFLSSHLVLPHATTKILDYKMHNGGLNTDFGKVCNLLTITAIFTWELRSDKTKSEYAKVYNSFLVWLYQNKILDTFMSPRGVETSCFLYWLIYNNDKKTLNLDIMVDLSEATKGSFTYFTNYMFALWTLRRINPNKTLDYSAIMEGIRKGMGA